MMYINRNLESYFILTQLNLNLMTIQNLKIDLNFEVDLKLKFI